MALAIETEDVVKVFRSPGGAGKCALWTAFRSEIERGATFGLLGPNGAGKTTFVKMLLGVIHPTAGMARLFGRDARLPASRRPGRLSSREPPLPHLLDRRGDARFLRGALRHGGRASGKRRIPELLELVGIGKWGDVRLKKYSKGMLQRLGLAQALMHSPSLLILDEPSDGVDPVGRREIREILHALEEKGVTIFINSHLLVEVELFCREVAILHRGKVALTGKVKELTREKATGSRQPPSQIPGRYPAARAAAFARKDGLFEFQFATREEVNEAVDLLRAGACEIEEITRTTSTLEDVFMRTVNA